MSHGTSDTSAAFNKVEQEVNEPEQKTEKEKEKVNIEDIVAQIHVKNNIDSSSSSSSSSLSLPTKPTVEQPLPNNEHSQTTAAVAMGTSSSEGRPGERAGFNSDRAEPDRQAVERKDRFPKQTSPLTVVTFPADKKELPCFYWIAFGKCTSLDQGMCHYKHDESYKCLPRHQQAAYLTLKYGSFFNRSYVDMRLNEPDACATILKYSKDKTGYMKKFYDYLVNPTDLRVPSEKEKEPDLEPSEAKTKRETETETDTDTAPALAEDKFNQNEKSASSAGLSDRSVYAEDKKQTQTQTSPLEVVTFPANYAELPCVGWVLFGACKYMSTCQKSHDESYRNLPKHRQPAFLTLQYGKFYNRSYVDMRLNEPQVCATVLAHYKNKTGKMKQFYDYLVDPYDLRVPPVAKVKPSEQQSGVVENQSAVPASSASSAKFKALMKLAGNKPKNDISNKSSLSLTGSLTLNSFKQKQKQTTAAASAHSAGISSSNAPSGPSGGSHGGGHGGGHGGSLAAAVLNKNKLFNPNNTKTSLATSSLRSLSGSVANNSSLSNNKISKLAQNQTRSSSSLSSLSALSQQRPVGSAPRGNLSLTPAQLRGHGHGHGASSQSLGRMLNNSKNSKLSNLKKQNQI